MEEEIIDEIDFSVNDSPTPRKRAHDSSSSPPRENFTGLLGGISHPIKKMKQTNMTSHPDSDEFSDEQNSFGGVPQNSQTVFVFEKIKRLSREELEQIVLQKMVEAITTVGPIKNLEQEICAEKQKFKIMERKIAELHQEVVSLTAIVRSFVSQPKNGKFKPPMKTTRSVGLQLTLLKMDEIKKFEPTSVNVDSQSTIIHIDDDDDRNGDDNDDDNDDDDDIIEIPIENNLRVSSNIAQQSDSFFNQNPPSVPSLPCLPAQSEDDIQGPIPPSPILQVSKVAEKIVLSWTNKKHIRQEKISSYQVWIFNEGESRILNRWEPMKDDIKAISSTMACEIPMAAVKPGLRSESRNRYHFAVRAVDLYSRFGHFSNVASTTFP